LGPRTNNNNNNKINIRYIYIYSEGIQKIKGVRKGFWNAHKWLEIGWGGSKIQELKFDSIFLTDKSLVNKENSIFEEDKSKLDVYGLN
jgi:hypothetical protein